MVRWLIRAASPPGPAAALSTLIFHRVVPCRDELFPGEITAHEFELICGWMSDWFNVLPLDEAVDRLKTDSLPARAACITFDDGYADNHEVAAPLLARHGLPATFFISTGFLDGGCMWNDRLIEAVRCTPRDTLSLAHLDLPGIAELKVDELTAKQESIRKLLRATKYLSPGKREEVVHALLEVAAVEPPTDLMMTSDQVKSLHRSSFGIGAHTVSHPILAMLDDDQARSEIATSRGLLEDLIGEPISMFAYPNGKPGEDYTQRDADLVRNLGFKGAVSTAWGVSQRTTDAFHLPRFTPWDKSRHRFGARLLANLVFRR